MLNNWLIKIKFNILRWYFCLAQTAGTRTSLVISLLQILTAYKNTPWHHATYFFCQQHGFVVVGFTHEQIPCRKWMIQVSNWYPDKNVSSLKNVQLKTYMICIIYRIWYMINHSIWDNIFQFPLKSCHDEKSFHQFTGTL